ncbi:MMPL family transporter [Phytohabitans flavus]|uniref:Membrane protein n=1 Tax=Phytohabitans flavus TaxID=1076124 RepID=A0A6F8XT34_9ACTN|nr:MMPL family transporter [Phytohabitans flavus]BCB76957.1 membrane protein [Phytohabitans flavus]
MPVSTPSRPTRTSRLARLAGWSQRHRWWALALWVLTLAALTVGSQAIGSDYHNDFSLPGTESQRAIDTLRERAPVRAGDTVQIVVQDPGGVTAAGTRERVETMLDRVRAMPHVADVQSPYAGPGAVSTDGTIAYATVTLDGQAQDVPPDDVRAIIDTAQAAEGGALRVELGGDAVRGAEVSEGGAAEGIGLLAALVILVLLFGSLLAASLPIVIAVFAVGSSIGLVVLASHLATIAEFTPPLMILVGLGVGIDYALLIFSRYRAELIAGLGGSAPIERDSGAEGHAAERGVGSPVEASHAGGQGAHRAAAARVALDTAGRTVFFAGCTVIIALMGLVALGLGSLQGVAVAVAVTVLVTMVASLTLLPALLAIFGRRIERGVRRRAGRARRPEGERWRRWAAGVQRRPWTAALVSVAALLAITAPALGIRLGFADAGNDAPSTTSRQAYDLLAEGFGPGFNGPLVVIVEGNTSASTSAAQALDGVPGVAATVAPPPTGDVATIIVFPASKPQDAQTHDLVQRLRDDVLPPLSRETGATFLVGGSVAAAEDFADAVAGRLPLFVAVVVGLSALLLMAVFRSLLIPVKAAVLNLLSVGASMGVITLVFQHGLLGAQPGPIEAYVPVMIFAIVFGLSMDYEVFLLSRMHEEWERRHDAPAAIREGLATTGRVVTAAAAIMVVVFGAFLLSPDRMLQQFGLGLAVAVLLDAVVIRCLVLPAVMHLLGARAWWLPRPIARVLPRLAIERPTPVQDDRPTPAGPGLGSGEEDDRGREAARPGPRGAGPQQRW